MSGKVRPDVFRPGPEHAYPAFIAEGRGACAGLPRVLADDFTLDPKTVAQHRRVYRAKLLCMGCPFRAKCAEWAIEHHPQEGVYGATTLKEREKIRATGK